MWRRVVPVLLCGMAAWGCAGPAEGPPPRELVVAPDMGVRRAQFVEQPLTAEISHLSEGDRQALRHLVAAAIADLTDLPVDVDPSYPLEGLQ